MRLKSELLQQKSEARNLESYTSMMQHEFITPLSTSLMFLELVLTIIKNAQCVSILGHVQAAMNLLLHLVKDLIDLKSIKENCFKQNVVPFNPE